MSLMEANRIKFSSRDAISSFPDEILARILLFLPTKQAIITCLLSKRWRNLFPLMIHLFGSQHRFDIDDSDLVDPEKTCKRESKVVHQSFKDFVDKTLFGFTSIKKLSLKRQNVLTGLDLTEQWIRNALERGLVDLDLRLYTSLAHEARHLPSSVFSNKTLVKLTLGLDLGDHRRLYPKVFLPMLKSLFIHEVWFRGEGLCRLMLPNCPILEELALHCLCGKPDGLVEPFFISHKTLKRLTVHYNNCLKSSRFMRFNTPSLVSFNYSGFAPILNLSDSFLDSLIEAKLDVHTHENYDVYSHLYSKTINGMCNVKTLSLSSASAKVMYSSSKELTSFLNLVKLCFESNTKEGWKVLPRLLINSPKLEILVLKGLHCIRNQGVTINKNEMKVLRIYEFRGSVRELSQVKYFLWEMKILQVMKVEIDADDNKKLQIMSHLLALPKRSSKCQIEFL
ncbi:unnamed protein product [Arabis nemorensis]|uniref:F-box domain-containing protein n=1 Tax=Arabis nemorensis TaxID=586526 RepID=A0A565BPR0_9BRAS|nr:unnamed protein product [Arabis nemorensis]